jgi:hypothetical protein
MALSARVAGSGQALREKLWKPVGRPVTMLTGVEGGFPAPPRTPEVNTADLPLINAEA